MSGIDYERALEDGIKLIREAVDNAVSLEGLRESIYRILACVHEVDLEKARENFVLS